MICVSGGKVLCWKHSGEKDGKLVPSRKQVLKCLCDCLCMSSKEDKNTQLGFQPRHNFQFQTSLRFLFGNTTTIPIWHLHDSSHSPVEMPLFYACLAFVALNRLHTFEQRSKPLWPPFVSRLATDIWTLFSVAQFPVLFKRDKREPASDCPKSHSPSCWAPAALTWTQWCGGRRSNCSASGVRQSSHPQGSYVCPQLPVNKTRPRHQRLQRGQIVEAWVWNNSCLINHHRTRERMLNSRTQPIWSGEDARRLLALTVSALHHHHLH